MATGHQPVLLEEAVRSLGLDADGTIVDATFGGGGHTRRILEELGDGGKLVGIDRDPEAAARAGLIEDERFEFIGGPFDEFSDRWPKRARR